MSNISVKTKNKIQIGSYTLYALNSDENKSNEVNNKFQGQELLKEISIYWFKKNNTNFNS